MDDKADQVALKRLLRAIEELRAVDPDMQLPMAATFLLVAVEGEVTRRELMDRLGVAGSTASRNLTGLTAEGRAGRSGHGLLAQRVDDDLRIRPASLSPKGQLLALKLAKIVRGEGAA